MADEALWSIQEVAQYLKVPVATVRKWNSERSGPAFLKIGKHVRYLPSEVRSWAKRRQVA